MIEISKAAVADVAEMTPLQQEVHALHVAHADWLFPNVDRATLAEATRHRIADEKSRAFVARRDGLIVGYALSTVRVRRATPMSRECRVLYLEEIGVRSDCRRMGVGRLLIGAIFSAARAEGIDRVELDAWAFNAEARTFFEGLGFTPQLVRMAATVGSE